MNNRQLLLATAALLLVVCWSSRAGAESAVAHRIQVQLVGRTLLAVRAAGNLAIDMGLNERVLWQGAFGDLGAVVTDRRLLVVSVTASEWQVSPLRLGEPVRLEASISSQLVLICVGHRIVGYDAADGRFLEWRHPMWERPLEVVTERDVGAVVYASGVVGYTVGGRQFLDHGFSFSERYRSHQVTTGIVTIQTSRRVLSYTSASSSWSETRRRFGD